VALFFSEIVRSSTFSLYTVEGLEKKQPLPPHLLSGTKYSSLLSPFLVICCEGKIPFFSFPVTDLLRGKRNFQVPLLAFPPSSNASKPFGWEELLFSLFFHEDAIFHVHLLPFFFSMAIIGRAFLKPGRDSPRVFQPQAEKNPLPFLKAVLFPPSARRGAPLSLDPTMPGEIQVRFFFPSLFFFSPRRGQGFFPDR